MLMLLKYLRTNHCQILFPSIKTIYQCVYQSFNQLIKDSFRIDYGQWSYFCQSDRVFSLGVEQLYDARREMVF